jgi:hypothetical protein
LTATPPKPCKPGLICGAFTVLHPRVCLQVCTPGAPNACPKPGFQCLKLGASGEAVCVETPCTDGQTCSFEKAGFGSYSCDKLGGQTNVCRPRFPTGAIDFGKACVPGEGKHCNASPHNAQCARRTVDFQGFCTVRCDATKPASCDTFLKGSRCQKLDDTYAVCFPPCAKDGDCPSHMRCNGTLCAFP